MGIITRMRKQDAVYWPRTGTDRYGKGTYGAAVAIDCRWEDVRELYLSPQGEEQVSNSIVYVDRAMVVGDLLWLGLLADAPAATLSSNGVFEIKKFSKVPNLRNTETLLEAIL